MLRAFELGFGDFGFRRLAAVGVLAVGGALAPLLLRARVKAHRRPESVEVACLVVDGQRYGAVYEEGRLVGLLEGIDRL